MPKPASATPGQQPSESVPTFKSLPIALRDSLSDLPFFTLPKLALLIRLSEAEAAESREGDEPVLQRMAWRGIEMLCRDVVRDLETLARTAGVQSEGFALLPDPAKGGAQ